LNSVWVANWPNENLAWATLVVAAVTLIGVAWQIWLALQRPNLYPGGARTMKTESLVEFTLYVYNNGASPAKRYLVELLVPLDQLNPSVNYLQSSKGSEQYHRWLNGTWYYLFTMRSNDWLFPNAVPGAHSKEVFVNASETEICCLVRLYDPYRKFPRWQYFAFDLHPATQMERVEIRTVPVYGPSGEAVY
jgi:hypothetical protein